MKSYLTETIFCFLILTSFISCNNRNPKNNIHKQKYLVDLVNPLIGTTGKHKTEYGGRIPAVMTPFGMTQWSAMTRENNIGRCPYHYDDDSIIGFTGTHQPSIWMGDYGYISFMPQTDTLKLGAKERGLKYSHQEEIAHPYYYSIPLHKGEQKIITEHTSSTRCGFFKFSFPKDKEAFLSIEMSRLTGYKGFLKIIPEKRQIVGYNTDWHNTINGKNMGPELEKLKGYFVMEFDTEFSTFGTYSLKTDKSSSANQISKNEQSKEIVGDQIGGYLSFDLPKDSQVKMKIGSSFLSIEEAQNNLKQEINHWDFAQTMNECRNQWEEKLKTIQIEGGTHNQQVLFYTCMCNSLMFPSIFSEQGKYYSPFDEKIHFGTSYNSYSLWDTFRALHPLLLFIAPERVSPMITSLLQMYDEGGWIPKWPNPTYSNIMIGTHSDAVIADACVKGNCNFDLEKAYEAIYKNAMVAPEGDEENMWRDRQEWVSYEGRGGLSWYKELGYVPADKTSESVSRTLEFAYDDYCVAQVAKKLGKEKDYEYFMQRSKNYRNVFNPETGFMHARLSNGNFAKEITMNRAFTEGSPWTYLFCIMQDIPGFIDLIGGKDAFIAKLDENFDQNHYRHDNEPGHHYIYLYNYAGEPWKAQKLISEVLSSKYQNSPDGLSGNDDCGQMSAWYIFSSMGFYPVTPGTDLYAIGKPLFKKVTINLDNGKTFTIQANNLTDENRYVKSIKLDGKLLDTPFIRHTDILNHKLT